MKGDQAMWMENALSSLQYSYPEIQVYSISWDGNQKIKEFESSERSQLVIHKHLTSSKPFIDKPPFITQGDILNAYKTCSYEQKISLTYSSRIIQEGS